VTASTADIEGCIVLGGSGDSTPFRKRLILLQYVAKIYRGVNAMAS